jgi:hypothetical protein
MIVNLKLTGNKVTPTVIVVEDVDEPDVPGGQSIELIILIANR